MKDEYMQFLEEESQSLKKRIRRRWISCFVTLAGELMMFWCYFPMMYYGRSDFGTLFLGGIIAMTAIIYVSSIVMNQRFSKELTDKIMEQLRNGR